MRPAYFVIDVATNAPIPAIVRPAIQKPPQKDFEKTESERWQTSWLSKFIQRDALENTHWNCVIPRNWLDLAYIAICLRAFLL